MAGIVGTLEKVAGASPLLTAVVYGLASWHFLGSIHHNMFLSGAGVIFGAAATALPAILDSSKGSRERDQAIIRGAVIGGLCPAVSVLTATGHAFSTAKLFARRSESASERGSQPTPRI